MAEGKVLREDLHGVGVDVGVLGSEVGSPGRVGGEGQGKRKENKSH